MFHTMVNDKVHHKLHHFKTIESRFARVPHADNADSLQLFPHCNKFNIELRENKNSNRRRKIFRIKLLKSRHSVVSSIFEKFLSSPQ